MLAPCKLHKGWNQELESGMLLLWDRSVNHGGEAVSTDHNDPKNTEIKIWTRRPTQMEYFQVADWFWGSGNNWRRGVKLSSEWCPHRSNDTYPSPERKSSKTKIELVCRAHGNLNIKHSVHALNKMMNFFCSLIFVEEETLTGGLGAPERLAAPLAHHSINIDDVLSQRV